MSSSMHKVMGGSRVLGVMALALGLAGCASDKPASGYGLLPAEPSRAAGLMPPPEEPATPDNEGMYRTLIERMQAQGLFFASLAHIAKFEQQFGANADTRLMRARALRETGQLAEATALYRQVLESPQSAAGWQGLGLIAGAQGNFAESAQALGQAAQRAPTDARILNDYGYALMRSGRLVDARVPLAQAAELDQSNPQVLSNLAVYLRASGEAGRADAVMERAQLTPVTRAAVVKLADVIAADAQVTARQGEERAATTRPSTASVPQTSVDGRSTASSRPVVSRVETAAAAPAESATAVRVPPAPAVTVTQPLPSTPRMASPNAALPMHSMFERFGAANP